MCMLFDILIVLSRSIMDENNEFLYFLIILKTCLRFTKYVQNNRFIIN